MFIAEHVYEGQSIGQFFTQYISTGKLNWWVDGKTVSAGRSP